MIDVNSLKLPELLALRKDIEQALAAQDGRAKHTALEAVKAAVASFGLTIHDLVLGKQGKAGKQALPAKYRNTADLAQTWSGRGRKPGWIKEAEAAGRDLADFAI